MKSAYPLPVEEFSWKYWFNYFYDNVDVLEQLQFFVEISPSEGVYRLETDIPEDEKKRLLLNMMDRGFVSYPLQDRLSSEEMFDSMRASGMANKGYELQNLGVKVVFRGDGRSPNAIKAVDGTKPQTRILALRLKCNFDKTWHPWNEAIRGNLVYFRKGNNNDNCLFTAISVTPNFDVATKFPLLADLKATKPEAIGSAVIVARPKTGSASVVANLAQKFENREANVLASRANIYVVKVKGGWNTETLQKGDAFPERAFENLRWSHHFAFFKVIRVHYGKDMNDGHLIVVEDFKWLQDFEFIKNSIGALAFGELSKILNGLSQKGKLDAGGVGGIHYVPPGVTPPLMIESIKSFTWQK